MKSIVKFILFIYCLLCCLVFAICYFYCCAQTMYGNFSIHQLIFHFAALNTMNFSQSVFYKLIIPVALSFGFIIFALKKPLLWLRYYLPAATVKHWEKRKYLLSFLTSTAVAVFGVLIAVFMFDDPASQMIEQAKYAYKMVYKPAPYDTIIDDNFVRPEDLQFQNPNPKNLVIIFAESLEKTFTDAKVFGADLLPNLYALDGTSANSYEQLSETDWTQASIFASLCGITAKQYFPKRYLSDDIVCISDITDKFGYYNYYLQGSSLQFTDNRKFLETHHFTKVEGIEDLPKMAKDKLLPYKLYSDKLYAKNFIGDILDDNELLEIFKYKLLELHRQKLPFMAVAFTMNTHPYDGYRSPNCPKIYKDMRDALVCADLMLGSFAEWFQRQDFAADTTLIILGDHLMMHSNIHKYLDKAGKRETLNLMWGYAAPEYNLDKPFNQFDWAPTLLQMAGFKWNGDKFALGTSLLSAEPTMQETYGDTLDDRLLLNSKFYEDFIFTRKPNPDENAY